MTSIKSGDEAKNEGEDSPSAGTAVTVGTFDGVHRGHLAVLSALRRLAAERGLKPMVITFASHPLATLRPGCEPLLVADPEESIEMLRKEVKEVKIINFTTDTASLTARDWMKRLRDDYGARLIVLGYDNSFGCDCRSLKREDYVELGRSLGVEVVEAGEIPGVSSSAVRRAVSEGRLDAAASMLGRFWSLTGEVSHGRALGRTIGFPTANVGPAYPAQLPATGVYAALAETPAGERYPAVVNVGYRPTVGGDDTPGIEAHLLGYEGDLYGSKLRLEFIARLRGEEKFDSLDALKAQIAADARNAQEILKIHYKGLIPAKIQDYGNN